MTVQAAGLAGSKAVSSLGLGLGKPFPIGVLYKYSCSGKLGIRFKDLYLMILGNC